MSDTPLQYRNQNLQKAKQKKNDEYYTREEDIAAEISCYQNAFAGKTVYCNCDQPGASAFWAYFHKHFAKLGLKKIMATYCSTKNPAMLCVYEGGQDDDIMNYMQTPLTGDGTFQSKECAALLQKADVVVSNPPFSMFRAYILLLIQNKKEFLVIGNRNLVTSKDLFPLMQEHQMWYGYHKVSHFLRPDGSKQTFGNIGWFTNLPKQKETAALKLTKKYIPEEYPVYCNCDAIHIDCLQNIPCDYDGAMGVPISFLEHYHPEQFEILGRSVRSKTNRIAIHHIPKEWLDLYFQQENKGHYTEKMHSLVYIHDGKAIAPYSRIIIRKKKDYTPEHERFHT